RFVQRQVFDLRDALRQQIGIDDPDRLVKGFNLGVGVETALTRSVRAGDHPEGRPLGRRHFLTRTPSGDPNRCRFWRRILATFFWKTVVRSSMKVALLASRDRTRTVLPSESRTRFSRTEPTFRALLGLVRIDTRWMSVMSDSPATR